MRETFLHSLYLDEYCKISMTLTFYFTIQVSTFCTHCLTHLNLPNFPHTCDRPHSLVRALQLTPHLLLILRIQNTLSSVKEDRLCHYTHLIIIQPTQGCVPQLVGIAGDYKHKKYRTFLSLIQWTNV